MNPVLFHNFFFGKRVAILGFAREGQSTYKAIRKYLPGFPLVVCDKNPLAAGHLPGNEMDVHTRWHLGDDYLAGLEGADLIIKTPGISFKAIENEGLRSRVISQTEIFLKLLGKQVVGITGTKGKSTTSSLLHHIFRLAGRSTVLAGNIGTPPFDLIDQISEQTVVVFEMSSHQLEHIGVSPHIAIFLNMFQEHLDHYHSYRDYQLAKANIMRWQNADDVLIFNPSNEVVAELVREFNIVSQKWALGNVAAYPNKAYCLKGSLKIVSSGEELQVIDLCNNRRLPGEHNLLNIAAASLAAYLHGVSAADIAAGVATFSGLPHRLEFVGQYRGIRFYNDSISTIPESTIEALKTFPETTTLILGGYDRGVDFKMLVDFLAASKVKNLVFIGQAGKRIFAEGAGIPGFKLKNCFFPKGFEEAFEMAVKHTPSGGICLLSPAAASYDSFRNFEHRGETFRELVRRLQG